MNLEQYREKENLTQQQVADALEITRQYVSDLERGVFKPSRRLSEKIIKWSKNNITYSELWDWQ